MRQTNATPLSRIRRAASRAAAASCPVELARRVKFTAPSSAARISAPRRSTFSPRPSTSAKKSCQSRRHETVRPCLPFRAWHGSGATSRAQSCVARRPMEPTIVSRSDNPALDWLPRTIRFVGPSRQAGHEGATCNSVDALAISGNSVASVFMRLSLGSASLYSDLLHSQIASWYRTCLIWATYLCIYVYEAPSAISALVCAWI